MFLFYLRKKLRIDFVRLHVNFEHELSERVHFLVAFRAFRNLIVQKGRELRDEFLCDFGRHFYARARLAGRDIMRKVFLRFCGSDFNRLVQLAAAVLADFFFGEFFYGFGIFCLLGKKELRRADCSVLALVVVEKPL